MNCFSASCWCLNFATIAFADEISVEDLYKKYAAAYDSDFEMPESESDSGEETTDLEETDGKGLIDF